jgi:hypothetical protein
MNEIDVVVNNLRDSLLNQYDTIAKDKGIKIPKNLSGDDLVRYKMNLATCIISARLLNECTVSQIAFLREHGFLLF